MSDNIPFDIQVEIIRKVSDVKSLVQFRSVSKPWKSFIDSSEFIKGYGARDTKPDSFMLMYRAQDPVDSELKYVSLVEENDNETLKVQQQEFAPFVVSPLLKQYHVTYVVGSCHGLVCFYGYNLDNYREMVLIWNPSIGKSFGIDVPDHENDTRAVYGFGVCSVTSDPTVVKVVCFDNKPWHVEVFTLSLGVWNVIPSGKLPHQSVWLDRSNQAVIDRFIDRGACDMTIDDDVYARIMVVSFDLITKEFEVVDLPENLTNGLLASTLSVSKLRGSLVVSGFNLAERACGVWVMEDDLSFTKLFTFGTFHCKTLGFRKNGETIFNMHRTLDVYDPCSQQTKNLGISGEPRSFFMDSYKQSLLLLDHPEFHIYSDDN